jgi:hypothetical protein
MKFVWGVIGGLLILTGGVWTLQGANVLPGSFMTGSTLWLVIGLIFVAGGVVLLYSVFRRKPDSQPE